jgi:hypothetical protein
MRPKAATTLKDCPALSALAAKLTGFREAGPVSRGTLYPVVGNFQPEKDQLIETLVSKCDRLSHTGSSPGFWSG